MATVKENLIAAKALIDSPDKWARCELINSRGCLCALGAVGLAKSGEPSGFWGDERSALIAALPRHVGSVASFNDEATHSQVMALFDRAIAAQDGA